VLNVGDKDLFTLVSKRPQLVDERIFSLSDGRLVTVLGLAIILNKPFAFIDKLEEYIECIDMDEMYTLACLSGSPPEVRGRYVHGRTVR
jgi:hypothetical protein